MNYFLPFVGQSGRKIALDHMQLHSLSECRRIGGFMINYSQARFRISEVAKACGVPPPTLKSYFQRGHLRLIGEMDVKRAEENGLPNYFSLRDALGCAVTLELMRRGVPSPSAFRDGMMLFAHTGDEERNPAGMFDIHVRGETLLIHYPEQDKSRLMASGDINSFSDLWIGNRVSGASAVVLVLNVIEASVFAALGV